MPQAQGQNKCMIIINWKIIVPTENIPKTAFPKIVGCFLA